MKFLYFVVTFIFTTTVWANSPALIAEDFKPIMLEDVAPAKNEIVDQAFAEAAQAAAEPTPSGTEATVATNTATLTAVKDLKDLKESEIPVLTKTAGQKTESKSPWSRLLLSFAIIAVVAAGLYQAAKWWQKKTSINSDSNKIKVLNQHFLGPRKSLAIIRVAGESILIGITDQNISLIKSLSLIEDEEIPSTVPQDFAAELNKKESDEDSSWSQVRDRVSTKIKAMRTL